MSECELRRFNPEGIRMVEGLHIPELTPNLPEFPLIDPRFTEPVKRGNESILIPDNPDIGTREDLMNLILKSIEGKMEISQVIEDDGLCAWLACKYHEKLRRRGGHSTYHIEENPAWHPFDLPRLVPTSHYKTYYRHCVRGILALYDRHQEEDLAWLLGGPASVHPDGLEQINSVPHLVTSRDFMRACNILYHDAEHTYRGGLTLDVKGRKTGYKKGAGGSGGGSPRRLITAYWQFHQTYRIDSMTAEQIISLLPNEFEKFKPGVSK